MVRSRVFEPPDLVVATLSGVVTSNDQAILVGWVRDLIRRFGEVRVLIVLHEFAGWKHESSLDSSALWLADNERMSRMAIVGDRKSRHAVLTTLAQPLRRIPIEYFETEREARRWLAADAESALRTLFI